MIGVLINLLIWLIVLGILWYAIDYAITHIPIPDPPARFIRIVLVVIFCLIVIGVLLDLAGGGSLGFPRLIK